MPARTRRASAGPTREEVLRVLRESHAGPAWHGPSLRAAVRGLGTAEAAWRPAPGRNSAWELVLHCAFGRHRMLRRLDRALAPRFPRPVPRDWWPDPSGDDDAAWAEDRSLLASYQERLLDAVSTVPASRLAARRSGQTRTLGAELVGLAMHDVYHAGQIVLLRRLARDRRDL